LQASGQILLHRDIEDCRRLDNIAQILKRANSDSRLCDSFINHVTLIEKNRKQYQQSKGTVRKQVVKGF